MKRTLSLLLSLVLLCGIFVPAVHAEEPVTYEVEINCPNWYTEMDPAKMVYEIKTPGFTLFRQPMFCSIAGGSMIEEPGMRRNDREYKLVIGLTTDLPFKNGDEIVVFLNGHRSSFQTTTGNHLVDSMKGSTAALYLDVGAYEQTEYVLYLADYLALNGKLSDLEYLYDFDNVECDASTTVYKGDTVNAPVMQADETFNAGSTYLFEVLARPQMLNQKAFINGTHVRTDGDLKFLPDRTVFNDPKDPDAVKLYFLYEPNIFYQIGKFTGEGYRVLVKDKETNDEVNEAPAGTVLSVSAEVPPELDFDHWEIEGLTLPENVEGNPDIEITMPANDINLTPVTRPAYNPFTDIGPDDWFYRPVMWANRKDVANGVSETEFGPRQVCNRAQAATMMVSYLTKSVKVDGLENPFTDIKPDDWYYNCIVWGYHKDLFTGKTESTFAPHDLVTRAEFITMLWSYYGSAIMDTEIPFTDVASDAYYYDAVRWAVKLGLVSGTDAEHFSPNDALSRAEAAAILYRTDRKVYL